MKRFHVNIAVADLGKSVQFYETLFGQPATVSKDDYAKWMLDDPRVNFSIAQSEKASGIQHIGLQVDSRSELAEIQARLDKAEQETFKQDDAQCCYAHSSKTWARDPDDVAWETFVTHGELTHYGNDGAPDGPSASQVAEATTAGTESRCCA